MAAEVVRRLDEHGVVLDVDPLTMWQDLAAPAAPNMDDADVIFLGGAWLEEDVLLAAVRAASFGYDVRLLADLSRLRLESACKLVIDRAAMHGILVVTLRQALLEWAAFSGDESTIAQVRALLA